MIISHRFRFIFVKTLKTAGTSVEVFLSQQCDARDVFTPIEPTVPPHRARNYLGWFGRARFFNHMSAMEIRARVPAAVWNGYYKFCIERNPWDKTLSHFHHLRDRRRETSPTAPELTFDQYLADGALCHNLPFYADAEGRVLVDRVVRYERLTEELGEVFGQLQVPFDGTLGVRAKSDHRRDARPYQTAYTDAQRQIIEQAFAREIALHGYQFQP